MLHVSGLISMTKENECSPCFVTGKFDLHYLFFCYIFYKLGPTKFALKLKQGYKRNLGA